ncbi:MAG: ABC transporter permease [Candidatus Bathyarchaeota archaeon]|nr:MAG: ABC transporter permease [Candidatus Bathyarchaeota archaeon]
MDLRSYIVARVLLMIPMIFLLLSIVFLIVRVVPGDPVLLHFEKKASEEAMAEMRRELRLDQPLHVQYFEYLAGLLRGDLGKSMAPGRDSISQHIFSAFPATLELALFSILIAVGIGILLGVRASTSYNSVQDHVIRVFGTVIYAIPVFFLGMILLLVFSIYLKWFPAGGRIKPLMEPEGLTFYFSKPAGGFVQVFTWSFPVGLISWAISLVALKRKAIKFWPKGLLISLLVLSAGWIVYAYFAWHLMFRGGLHITGLYTIDSLLDGNVVKFVEAVRYLFLPSLTLGLMLSGVFIRLTRSNMLETLRLDFVTAARARGLKESSVVYGYALRNAFLPILTMMGLQFAMLLGGAILTETTFSWPGLGRYLVDRISFRDYTAIQGAVIFFGILVAVVNLVVDILYAYLDPRIRF